MNTFAYALICLGLVIMYEGAHGRTVKDLPGDIRDLGVGLATFDAEQVSEVINRKTESAGNTDAFDKVDQGGVTADTSGSIDGTSGNGGTVGPSGKSVGDLVALGKQLRAMGWNVSENKALGDNPRPGVHLATGYHYKYDNSGAIDVNWPNASIEKIKADAIVPAIRARGFHVLWQVKGHYNHFHVDISRKDI